MNRIFPVVFFLFCVGCTTSQDKGPLQEPDSFEPVLEKKSEPPTESWKKDVMQPVKQNKSVQKKPKVKIKQIVENSEQRRLRLSREAELRLSKTIAG